MSEEDKKLQKQLVDEMMKVYETNPNVMLYMQTLMENYEKLEQENKQLKENKKKAIEYLKTFHFIDNIRVLDVKEYKKLLEILRGKEDE